MPASQHSVTSHSDFHELEPTRAARPQGVEAAFEFGRIPIYPQIGGALQRKCDECEDEDEERLQRAAVGGERDAGGIPSIVHEVLRAGGAPLDSPTRAHFEPRIGIPLHHVRLHTDTQAGDSARAVGAMAYTMGHHVVIQRQHWMPGTIAGNKLLGHELVHVRQQSLPGFRQSRPISDPHEPAEEQADRIADAMAGPGPARRMAASAPAEGAALQRKREGESHGYRDPRLQTITAIDAQGMTDAELEQAIEDARKALELLTTSTPESDALYANLEVLQVERDLRAQPKTPPQPALPSSTSNVSTLHSSSAENLISSMEGGTSIQAMGIVQVDEGADLYTAPSTAGTPTARLPLNTRLFVVRSTDTGWYFVVLENGSVGYVAAPSVNKSLPEPGARLHRILGGESALAIVKQYYKGNAIEWGQDERFYVNVLVLVNAEAERKGIYKPANDADWDQTKTIEGRQIWIPSLEFAKSLRGKVSSGSISYEVYQSIRSAAVAAGEFLLGTGAFVAGLLHGALESLWDLVVGLVDLAELAWSVIESLLTGEILNDAGKLMNELAALDLAALIDMGLESIQTKWNDPDLLSRWHYRGWLLGYIIMELLMLVFSDGLLTAVKWVGKSAKLGKILARLPTVAKLADKAKLLKGEKVAKLGEGLKGEKFAKAAKTAEAGYTWARETLKIPLDIVRQFTDDMFEALKRIPKWAQEQITAMTDGVKRGLFCTSPCRVNVRAIWRRLEKIVEIRGVLVRGFNNAGELIERVGNLRNRIKKTGIDDVVIGLRGSSVTGISSKGGEFRWLNTAGGKASDVDFFFTSKKLQQKLEKRGVRFKPDGRLDPAELAKHEPELAKQLDAFAEATGGQLGRKANAILLTEDLAASLKPLEHVIF